MPQRYVAGRLHLPDPAEPGTIPGPKDTTGEHMVVIGQNGDDTLVGYASPDDLRAAVERMADGGAPRSVKEHGMRDHVQAVMARRAALAEAPRRSP